MIYRTWHGRTVRERADERRAIPDYRSVTGNLGAMVLRRDDGAVTHFLTVSLWRSEADIRAQVQNYEVVASEFAPGP